MTDPRVTADRIIEQVELGGLSQGQWISLSNRVERLPARLRRWTWARLQKMIGAGAVRYLRRWAKGERE